MKQHYTQLVAALLFLVGVCESKFVDSQIKDTEDFAYLGKFCFDTSGPGIAVYNFSQVPGNGQLLLFDDEQQSWSGAYKVDIPCAEKIQNAKKDSNGNVINITIKEGANGYLQFGDFQRPHFWYLAAAFCGGSAKGLNYKLHMFQSEVSLWQHEFSYDEQGLEALYMVYFIFFLVGLAAHVYAVFIFMRAQSYHPVVKLLTGAIVLEFLSIFCLFIHYVVYAHNGVGVPGLRGIGDLLDIGAQLVFILLLILVANGWCITKMHVDNRLWLFGGMGVLAVFYLIMFIWGAVGVDPATNNFIYDSVPGVIILVLRAIATIWFAISILRTFREENHPTKKKFYTYFGLAFIVWFLLLPLVSFIAFLVSLKSPWVLQKTVMPIYVTSTALGFAALGYLLWPTHATEYFQISTNLDIAGTIPYEAI